MYFGINIEIRVKKLKQVQQLIETLECHSPAISVPWNYDLVSKMFLEKKDLDTVRALFRYFFKRGQEFYEFVWYEFFKRKMESFEFTNLQIYFEELNKVAIIQGIQIFELKEYLNLYSKYKSSAILDFIADPYYLSLILLKNIKIDEKVFKSIVQRIDRTIFIKELDDNKKYVEDLRQYEGWSDWQLYFQVWKQNWITKYDKASKERAVDVLLGLGYAQFDNQVQSTIPSLVLQQIVNESADLSGMPTWQVYQIVKHINEGITDKTIRLGLPDNQFKDTKEEDIKITRLGLPDNEFYDAE
jgi:hypothetical protein